MQTFQGIKSGDGRTFIVSDAAPDEKTFVDDGSKWFVFPIVSRRNDIQMSPNTDVGPAVCTRLTGVYANNAVIVRRASITKIFCQLAEFALDLTTALSVRLDVAFWFRDAVDGNETFHAGDDSLFVLLNPLSMLLQ